MNKMRIPTTAELRAALLQLGDTEALWRFGAAIAVGKKITAVRIARKAGVLPDE